MDDYESVLAVIRECYVYRIPPRMRNAGYKAQDWNVESFLWKGRLRVVATGEKCDIRLEDENTGELFAVCPYTPENNSVEPVLDSSRYFVLRIEDNGKRRHAFVGMGFLERSEAFDFNVALQDFSRRLKTEKEIAECSTSTQDASLSNDPKHDYSLKDGEMLSLKIGKVTFQSRLFSRSQLTGS
ncbi:adaptin ear-binding coat-associated protein 1 NECAP-1 [Basidiobolus meristosporus CBS 931.73]|uniref:Adaptin ear-binding coat-associated protein 1 NECAP-1 n=1 Tax=Basidiobolus meristosporus CBS 931.73 TaxID=1314790 RepID=A0A1Y1Y4B0_9FUNG|nr:adaptin ear-binding coat-associated protein 1 NECAP-1 [Basidiobolus meristosporus CBS 931.73]|eukprot:ORX92556.1 adaptin ear-binding coat-associated protein 1 NECAP-1 [Basidiobolus meristosporus CBS 931.73]